MLRGLIGIAAGMGVKRLVGEYPPTAKNGVVADLFPAHGFSVAGGSLFVRNIGDGVEDLVTYVTGLA